MSIKTYILLPLQSYLKQRSISESEHARQAQLSRLTLRALRTQPLQAQLSTWSKAINALNIDLVLCTQNGETLSDCSVQAVSYLVLRDGEDSWKIHFMNFVDEFRRTFDTRLFLLPPARELNPKLTALLASIVCALCREQQIVAPPWANKRYSLDKPWFVSGSEALKPMMLLESPLEFRRNQIFVGQNFLDRA